MGYEDQRSRAMSVGNGINVAAALAVRYEEPLEWFENNVLRIVDTVIAVQAANAIDEAMPGTTTMPAAVPTPVPAIANANVDPFAHVAPVPPAGYQTVGQPYPAAAPVAIPGAADGDPVIAAQWVEFFNDPSAWWNNTNDPKRPPRAPEFKHKTKKDAQGKYPLGLWRVGKGNPSWVPAALQQAGL